MKVLHLWDSYAPGLFDHSFDICLAEGIEARLVCMHFLERGAAPGSRISYVRERRDQNNGKDTARRVLNKVHRLIDQARFRRLARKVARSFDPDVIHIHYGTTAALLENVSEVTSRPFIISFYGFDISQGVRTATIRRAYQRLMKKRPLVHVLCDEAAERIIALGGERERIVDANLPLNVERYPYVGVGHCGPFRWLIPARFVEKKGHAVALRAFKQLLAQRPDSRLTCWGYGDPGWLRVLVRNAKLDASVDVIDNSREGPFDAAFAKRLLDHDAVLAPSIRSSRGDDEGGPALTAVLAQVSGKPLIVSDFPGHERSVTDGVDGFVVPQGDADRLAEAMAKMASDRNRARAFGKAGRERAIHAFSLAAYSSAILGWYRALAK